MRTPPNTLPDVMKRTDLDLITETRRYKVITPLFGGGVTPGEADPVTVVRATEVRGHLRFWWRATRGGQFNGDLSAMKAAEERIWGSAGAKDKAGPSSIAVIVSDAHAGPIRSKVEVEGRYGTRQVDIGEPFSPYSYVAFPLRTEKGKPAGAVRDDVEFTLTIRYRLEQSEDVAAALWAWETFGGIGARTRRGFGALTCIEVNEVHVSRPSTASISDVIQQELNRFAANGVWHRSVPHLIREFRVAPAGGKPNADEAWKYLFKKLQSFRQARFPDSQGRSYGRSKWPEPDAIRALTKQAATKHSKARVSVMKFPRAAFGLPIIFQFKDSELGDPQQTSLEGTQHDRLASPLILRPLSCADGKYVGLAAILQAPTEPPNGIRLKGAPDDPVVRSSLSPVEAKRIEPLDGNTDILQAFLNWL